MRRNAWMIAGTSSNAKSKLFGLTEPSFKARVCPWVWIAVFSSRAAMRLAPLILSMGPIIERRETPCKGLPPWCTSAAFRAEILGNDEGILHPARRQIVFDHLRHRLEQLEMMAFVTFR